MNATCTHGHNKRPTESKVRKNIKSIIFFSKIEEISTLVHLDTLKSPVSPYKCPAVTVYFTLNVPHEVHQVAALLVACQNTSEGKKTKVKTKQLKKKNPTKMCPQYMHIHPATNCNYQFKYVKVTSQHKERKQ